MRASPRRVSFDEGRIDAIFAPLNQCRLPGAAVGVAIGGRPVYRKGFGLANMELPVVLSPTVRMRMASVSKHIACLACLLVCEEGTANIDDAVGKYLPELHPVACGVTLRQLMSHTSGLRDAKEIALQFNGTGRRISSEDLLTLYRDLDDVNFAPGTSWCYNNGGYVLLTFAIERITGQSFETVLRERIFEPLGMYDSMVRRWDTDFVPNSASLHMARAAGGYEKSWSGVATAAEGGIVTTIDDLLRWLAHMDAPTLGSEAIWQMMKTPHTLANGSSTGYGLGLANEHYRGVRVLRHPGATMGGSAQMTKVPEAGLDVVVLSNREDVLAPLLANEILDACLPALEALSCARPHTPASGTYRSPTSSRVVQLFAKDGVQMALIDGVEVPFAADADGILRPSGMAAAARLAIRCIGDALQPASIQLTDFGNGDDLMLVGPADERDMRAVVGRYRSESTHTEATIEVSGDGARLHTAGRFGSLDFRLECLGDRIWRSKCTGMIPFGGTLVFDRSHSGFLIFTARTRALPFERVSGRQG